MLFWLVILGAWMGWVETVYSKPEKPLTATDWRVELPDIPEPPEMFRAEPAVAEAEKLVRSKR